MIQPMSERQNRMEQDRALMVRRGRPVTLPLDASATVRLLEAEEGGRSGPVETRFAYRPNFVYGDHWWCCQVEFPDVDAAHPGDTLRTLITFLTPENHRGRVAPGMAFDLYEGPQKVGTGTITEILELEAR